jgi:hypothetical protein
MRRDPGDGTQIVPGHKGRSHLFDYGDGLLGVAVIPASGSAYWWNAAREVFAAVGMAIRQNGDHEGIATFDPQSPEQTRLALKYAGVRRRKQISAEHKAKLQAGLLRAKTSLVGEGLTA